MTETGPTTRTPETADADASAAAALALLADGVPLSLLLDLAGVVPSHELYREEAGDTRWLASA